MRHLLLATALIVATPAPVIAQTPQPTATPTAGADRRDEARAKLIAADTNKDGKWDKTEWLAAGRRERGFNFLDGNGDGFVTPAELKTGMERAQTLGLGGPN